MTPADGELRLCSAMMEIPGARRAAANPRGGSAPRRSSAARRSAGSGVARAPGGHVAAGLLDDGIERVHGASLWVALTKRSRAVVAAPESTACRGGGDAVGEGGCAAPGVDRRARVEHGEIARRAGGAGLTGEDAPDGVGVLRRDRRRAPPRRPPCPARRRPATTS